MKIQREPSTPGEILNEEFLKPLGVTQAALRMSPEFWLNAQQAVDIYRATRKLKKVPQPIPIAG